MIIRSLEQTNNQEAIRANILHYLQHPQVVHWFAKRTTDQPFQKKLSTLVSEGKPEEAIRLCEKEVAALTRKATAASTIQRLRSALNKLIRR